MRASLLLLVLRAATTASFMAPSSVLPSSARAVRMAELTLPATVDEAKKRFYGNMGRALSMQTAAFVNEMIQSTTFAMVSPTWQYNRVFALGFEKLCDEFLVADDNAEKVRESLCVAFGYESATVAADAKAIASLAEGNDEAAVLAIKDLADITANDGKVKYTYTFGAGLVSLMKAANVDPKESIGKWCDEMKLDCKNSFTRDYDYYASSVEKLEQMQEVMKVMKEGADRDKAKRDAARAEKAKAEAEKAAEAA